MHSVTSNGVARALSFYETEQFIGGYWIDGKPIYRYYIKTPTFDPRNKVYKTYSVAGLGIDTCIAIKGFIYRKKSGYLATYDLNSYESPTMFCLTKYEYSLGKISLITQLEDSVESFAEIFIEYTKA